MNTPGSEGIRSLGMLLDPSRLPEIPGRPLQTVDTETGLPFVLAQEKRVFAIFNGSLIALDVQKDGVEALFLPRFQTTAQKEGKTDVADGILNARVVIGESIALKDIAFVSSAAIVGRDQSIFKGEFPEDMRASVVGDTVEIDFTAAGIRGNPYPAYAQVRLADAKAGRLVFTQQEVIKEFGMGKNAMPVLPLEQEGIGEPIVAFRPEIARADGRETIAFIQRHEGRWRKIHETNFPPNVQGRSGLVGSERILAADGTHRMLFHQNRVVNGKTIYELMRGKVHMYKNGAFDIVAIDPIPLITPSSMRALTGDKRRGVHLSKDIVYAVGSIYDEMRKRFLVAITYADQVTYLVEIPSEVFLRPFS